MLTVKLTESKDFCAFPESLEAKIDAAWQKLLDGADKGAEGYGWMNLPNREISGMKETAALMARNDYIILIGIGGSALGTQMLMQTLLDPLYPGVREKGRPALFIADNADAESNEALWKQVDPRRTALFVVSKSGRTLETLSNFIFFRGKLIEALGDAAEEHIFAVTDGAKGFLCKYARQKGTKFLEFPGDTGGRYSVLSSCGLAAALALGMDAGALLRGASDMKKKLLEGPRRANAASRMAAGTVLGYRAGRNVTVFMTYGDRLKSVGEWFAQLWGESLGKDGLGMTPQAALGSVDQHSQLQLYTEGPKDKFFFFLSAKAEPKTLISIPKEPLFDEARYLDQISQEFILDCERRGVVASLKRRDNPLCEIELSRVDEYCLGGLIFLLEAVTALAGFLMDLNPFDQPGVEEGKNYALALCGHPDYQKYGEVLRKIESESVSTNFEV